MLNMIKADLYRINKNIAFYIAIAFTLLMIGVSVYMVQPGSVGQASVGDVSTTDYMNDGNGLDDISMEEASKLTMHDLREMSLNSEGYKFDKNFLAANMNLYYIFIFIAAIAITVDFSAGSVKNTLSSAISRKKYFISKTLFVIGTCILIFFMNTYLSYLSNLIFNEGKVSSDLWTVTKISLLQLPPMLALISILIGIAFIFRKTSIFNIITIPLVMVFQLALNLVIMLFDLNSKIINYEFQVMIGKLTSEPSCDYITKSYIYCAVLIIAFLSLGYISFRKSEIK